MADVTIKLTGSMYRTLVAEIDLHNQTLKDVALASNNPYTCDRQAVKTHVDFHTVLESVRS